MISEAESQRRKDAEDRVLSLRKEFGGNSDQLLNELRERERTSRLQSDTAGSPIYVEALVSEAFLRLPIEDAIEEFRRAYKARGQTGLGQQRAAELALLNLRGRIQNGMSPEEALPLLEKAAATLDGGVHVEETLARIQYLHLETLVALGKKGQAERDYVKEAAILAEQLQPNCVGLETKEQLELAFLQISSVCAIDDPARKLLSF